MVFFVVQERQRFRERQIELHERVMGPGGPLPRRKLASHAAGIVNWLSSQVASFLMALAPGGIEGCLARPGCEPVQVGAVHEKVADNRELAGAAARRGF